MPFTSRPVFALSRHIVRVEVIALLLMLIVRLAVLTPFSVVGDSMAETYHSGDTVWVLRTPFWSALWPIARDRAPVRGDVVVFQLPGRDTYIKRVVGIPRDVVEIRDGHLIRNGEVVEESYVTHRSQYVFPPTRVPDGYVFVLGDNRANSVDSHLFGPIPLSAIHGRVIGHLRIPTVNIDLI